MDAHNENPTLRYIEILAEIGRGDESTGSIARRLALALAKPAKACPLGDIPQPERSALEEQLKRDKPRLKLCHDNAWRLCVGARGGLRVDIVSGFANSLIPMEHSWVRVHHAAGSTDFDPTDWGCFEGHGFSHHVEVISINQDKAIELASRSGHSGPWVNELLFDAASGSPNAQATRPMKRTRRPKA